MKLQTLKPRARQVDSARMQTLTTNPNATPRLRGRAGVERRARWLQAHPLCKHCEDQTPARTTAAVIVDHVIPLFEGGPDDDGNLQSLCQAHSDAKTATEARRRAGWAGGV